MRRAGRRGWWARIGGGWALCAAVVALSAPVPANAAEWIVDPSTGCGTTSLFAEEDESIRWYGACREGKLDGPGVLIWYQGGIESERDEGSFRDGELEGQAVTASEPPTVSSNLPFSPPIAVTSEL